MLPFTSLSSWHANPEQRPAALLIKQTLNNIRQDSNENSHIEDSLKRHYPFDLPDSDDIIVKEEVRDVIQRATLYKYIERFTLAKYREDASYVVEFILTHKMFSTSSELYRVIKERFIGPEGNWESVSEEQRRIFQKDGPFIQQSIHKFIRKWIRHVDYIDEETYDNLSKFIFTFIKEGPEVGRTVSENVNALLERPILKKTDSLTPTAFTSRKKLIQVLKERKDENLKVVKLPVRTSSQLSGTLEMFSSNDFVLQSTIMEATFFKKLRISEFLGQVKKSFGSTINDMIFFLQGMES